MRYQFIIAALVMLIASASYAQNMRIEFEAIRATEQSQPMAAFEAMTALAGDGFAPAMDRVGYYLRKGVGTQPDLTAARHWYARAVSAGHPWSTASLARVEMELGHDAAALQLLHIGIAQDRPGTKRLLATAHIDRKLGPASDPKLGRSMLEDMAKDADANAARDLLVRINWKRLDGRASENAVALVVGLGLEGDARFAEAALIYLSRQNDRSEDVIQTRSQLTKVPGIRGRILSPERIRLAAQTSPRQFWLEVEAILGKTDASNYARTANTAFWINKNAWVRVLQKELRALGYYDGGINGRMTRRSISAQNRY